MLASLLLLVFTGNSCIVEHSEVQAREHRLFALSRVYWALVGSGCWGITDQNTLLGIF